VSQETVAWWVLGGECLLLVVILFWTLAASLRGDSARPFRTAFFASLFVSAGVVAIQYFFVMRTGWWTLVPSLGLVALLLCRCNWAAMRSAGLVVLLLSSASIFVIVEVAGPKRDAVVEAMDEAVPDVVRFQQVEEGMGFVPETETRRGPPVVPRETGPVEPEKPDVPDWMRARGQVRIGGSMLIEDGSRVAMVGGRMLHVGALIGTVYSERQYTWRIIRITREGVGLERIEVKPIHEPVEEVASSNEMPAEVEADVPSPLPSE